MMLSIIVGTLQIYDNGTVWTNARLRVQGPCSMNFINFPLDSLKCMLIFESYSYNAEEVRLRWFPSHPVSFLKKVTSFTAQLMTMRDRSK